MEKNIIICWRTDSAADTIKQVEEIKKLKLDAQQKIATITNEPSEFRKAAEKVMDEVGYNDDGKIIKNIQNLKLNDYESYKKVFEYWGDIPANEKNKKKAKLDAIIELEKELSIEKNARETIWHPYFDYNIVGVCSNFSDFEKTLGETEKVDGIIVLCELKWDDYKYKDIYNGITLVQKYIRTEKKMKVPVVFVSQSTRNEILDIRPDTNIISTPALQHKFIVYNTLNIKEILCMFNDMKELTKRQLEYTTDSYCDSIGLLSYIKHQVGKCKSDRDLEAFRNQLLYVVSVSFCNDVDKKKEVADAVDGRSLEIICEKYRNELRDNKEPVIIRTIDYICDSKDKQLRTLILDDDPNDKYTQRLVSCMNMICDKVSSNGYLCSIAKPVVKTNVDDFMEELGRKQDAYYNNIILDVEIWNELHQLEALGFDIADEIMAKKSTPLQINMITNTTRSLHAKLVNNTRNDEIKGIYLKEEVLASDAQAIRFIRNIIKEWDYNIKFNRRNQYQCSNGFQHTFSSVMRRLPENVTKTINGDLISNEGKADMRTYSITNYDEMEVTVNDLSDKLINRFLAECSNKTSDDITWAIFDNVCETMRDVIRKSIGSGNEGMNNDFKSFDKQLEPKHIWNFAIRLVLRRFFLYIKQFINHHNLIKKFDDFREKKSRTRYDINWGYKDSDLACRAINTQFKGHNKGNTIENNTKCLTQTLLYTKEIDEQAQLTEEEKTFVEYLIENKNTVFNYA